MSEEKHLHMERKILKWGNSYAIRIPKEFLEKLGINPDIELTPFNTYLKTAMQNHFKKKS
ncbi:AbrB/MazE/SpoVT family DNA-binding domain-containing protein [Salicibibacter cibarius]|uniref:AbrB/MazE/SpoVT family DNA-binding domain-containing protein n=1 Tax=Salicibibacter cibarius TaxID=2743000 RepID=A0A7T6Z5C0_9BACI|nr:AbrB/MazE/SpoVT family DNA-binding domain-containing protein [Salicibibacter cibarius]QQK77091.1 AbrB/MazE/SpoVT family DNA-binding domain-containing protein [Salicibibacter cibarius]